MSQFLRALAKGTPEDLEKAIQDYNAPMMAGVEQVEPLVQDVVREPALDQPQMLQEEIDHPGLTDEEFAAQINRPGIVESGLTTEDRLNELRGQEGLEPDKPKTILDQLNELRQKSDKELEHSRTMDAMSQLINAITPLHENRMRARAMRDAQSVGADPGKLNLPQMPTDSAQMVLQDRQQKIKDLMDQLKMGAGGAGRVFQTRQGLVRLDEEGKPIEIYKDPVVQEQLEAMKSRLGLSGDRLDFQKSKQIYREKEKFEDDINKVYKEMRSNKEFQGSEKIVNTIGRLKNLIEDAKTKGGQSLAMLGPIVAKGLAGETGVLTEQDVTRYTQNPQLAARINDMYLKNVKGKITDLSAENLIRLAEIMEQGAREVMDREIDSRANQFAKSEGLNYDEARYYLDHRHKPVSTDFLNKDIEKYISSMKQVDSTAPDVETVKLRAPNGQVRLVKRSQMQKYIDKGATLVED